MTRKGQIVGMTDEQIDAMILGAVDACPKSSCAIEQLSDRRRLVFTPSRDPASIIALVQDEICKIGLIVTRTTEHADGRVDIEYARQRPVKPGFHHVTDKLAATTIVAHYDGRVWLLPGTAEPLAPGDVVVGEALSTSADTPSGARYRYVAPLGTGDSVRPVRVDLVKGARSDPAPELPKRKA